MKREVVSDKGSIPSLFKNFSEVAGEQYARVGNNRKYVECKSLLMIKEENRVGEIK